MQTAQNGPNVIGDASTPDHPQTAQGAPIPPAWWDFSAYLRHQWRRLRNVAIIESLTAANADLRRQLTTQTTRADSLELTLAVARGIAAESMRERDHYDGALDRTCRELAIIKHRRRIELKQSRLWITRCAAVDVRSN